jgi:hypothetical protein
MHVLKVLIASDHSLYEEKGTITYGGVYMSVVFDFVFAYSQLQYGTY